jgi:hypothetical protein
MLPLSHPDGNGARPISPARQPATPPSGPPHPAAGGVSRLDRVTLQLGVAVAVVIALCSYAVSATSLYALGVQAGYSWWQAAAVPVVADGPAIYGMFRIVSRSRRGAKGAGYGWLLVIAGTLASIGGNVAHAHPNLVAQAIAAAIPLAVLAMLEGLKGDAGEVTRLAAQAITRDGADTLQPAGQLPQATTVRRSDPTTKQHQSPGTFSPGRRALPAAPATPTANGTVGGPAPSGLWSAADRRTALDGPHPGRGRRLWPQQRRRLPATPPPTSCGAHAVSRPRWQLRDAALGYAARGIPVLPLHYPSPTAATSSRSPAIGHWSLRRCGPAARVGIRVAASPASTPSAAWCPTGSRTPRRIGRGCWPG